MIEASKDYIIKCDMKGDFASFKDFWEQISAERWFEHWIPINRSFGDKRYDCYLFSVNDIQAVEVEVRNSLSFIKKKEEHESDVMSCVKAAATAHKHLHEAQKNMADPDFYKCLCKSFLGNISSSLGYTDGDRRVLIESWMGRIEKDLETDIHGIKKSAKFDFKGSVGTVCPESFAKAASESCKYLLHIRKSMGTHNYDQNRFEHFLMHENFFHYIFNSLGNYKEGEWQFLECCLNN